MSEPSRHPHLVRGVSAGSIATFASLCAHVFAGGDMPGPLGIAVPLLLSVMVGVLLAGRKLSHIRLSLSVVASQALFHTLFVLGTPIDASSAQSAAAAHQHGAPATLMPMLSEQTITHVHGDTTMWVSHFMSALITVIFLARGEHALIKLRELTEWLVAWVQRTLGVWPTLPKAGKPQRLRLSGAQGWTALAQLQASTLHRRGPPQQFRIAH